MKRASRFLGLCMAALVFALTTLATSADAEDVIKIGVVYSLTGNNAVVAKLTQDGVRLAIKEANDSGGVDVGGKKMKITPFFCDAQSSGITARKCVTDMVNDQGVRIIIGGVLAHVGMAMNEESKKHSLFLMNTMLLPETFFRKDVKAPNALSVLGSAASAGRAAAEYLAEEIKPKSVVCFVPAYAFGEAQYAGFESIITKYLDIKSNVLWHPLGTSETKRYFFPVAEFKPDVVVIGSFGQDAINALTQAHETGLTKRAKIFHIWMADAFGSAVSPEAMEHVSAQMFWYHDARGFKDEAVVKASEDFAKQYTKEYGIPPDPYAMGGYSGMKEIVRAMALSKSTDPASMYEALMVNPEWSGPKGKATWRKDGRPIYDVFSWIVKGKGPGKRSSARYDEKFDFAEVADVYSGRSFAPKLEDLGY